MMMLLLSILYMRENLLWNKQIHTQINKKFNFEEFREKTTNIKDSDLESVETKEPSLSKMFSGKVFGAEDAFMEDYRTSKEIK